ncbi:MAG: hypothetical protein ACJ8C4_01000 [Gemmataceae bacterium]
MIILCICSTTTHGVDLTTIPRTIRKEPNYRGQPKYCLLVFGPEAKTRVWLVQDGDTLYVDLNGNGDLTEPGDKITAKKNQDPDDRQVQFDIGKITDGERTHVLSLDTFDMSEFAKSDSDAKQFATAHPGARGIMIWAALQIPSWTGDDLEGRVRHRAGYSDVDGFLQFADRPQDAPIIHFGGPMQITLWERPTLRVGRQDEIILVIATLGVGSGTRAFMSYNGIVSPQLHPKVEITFAGAKPGESPVKELYELKQWC